MIAQTFSLIPFPAPEIPAISISGKFSFQDQFLSLHYSMRGSIEDILLPPLSMPPHRRDELWKFTCFEFFIAIKGRPGYWEFNMSPSGAWNAYCMDDYRRIGFREEAAVPQLPFEFKRGEGSCSLDVSLDVNPFVPPQQELQMAITSIIQTKDGSETYWALAHPASHADFHVRESFILTLAGQARFSEQSASDG